MQTFFARFVPFLVVGIMLVLLFVGLFILSNLLIFGAIVGMILYAVAWIRELLTRKKSALPEKKRSNRTIEH